MRARGAGGRGSAREDVTPHPEGTLPRRRFSIFRPDPHDTMWPLAGSNPTAGSKATRVRVLRGHHGAVERLGATVRSRVGAHSCRGATPHVCLCQYTSLAGLARRRSGSPRPERRAAAAGRAPPGDMRYIYIQGLEKQETAPSQPALNHARLHAHPTPLPDRNCSCVFVTLARRSPLCGHKREGGQQGPHYR